MLLTRVCPVHCQGEERGWGQGRGRSPLHQLPTSPSTERVGRATTAIPEGCLRFYPALLSRDHSAVAAPLQHCLSPPHTPPGRTEHTVDTLFRASSFSDLLL